MSFPKAVIYSTQSITSDSVRCHEIEPITLKAIASVRSDPPKLRNTSVVTLKGGYQDTLVLRTMYCFEGYLLDTPLR